MEPLRRRERTRCLHSDASKNKTREDKRYDESKRKCSRKRAGADRQQQQQILRDLLALGKKNGRLTLKEISDALSHLELSSEDIDKVYETLETMGIEVETERCAGEGASVTMTTSALSRRTVEEVPEEELVDTSAMAETFAIDDPVRMYLKEIGKVDLLSP